MTLDLLAKGIKANFVLVENWKTLQADFDTQGHHRSIARILFIGLAHEMQLDGAGEYLDLTRDKTNQLLEQYMHICEQSGEKGAMLRRKKVLVVNYVKLQK